MPLSEKARIEVYLPDLPEVAYEQLVTTFDREFCHAFGGATILRDVRGGYLNREGQLVHDRINLIYTDTPFTLRDHFDQIARYADKLRSAVLNALHEEAALVVVIPVYHAT